MLMSLPAENMYRLRPWLCGDHLGRKFGSPYKMYPLLYGLGLCRWLGVEDVLPCRKVSRYQRGIYQLLRNKCGGSFPVSAWVPKGPGRQMIGALSKWITPLFQVIHAFVFIDVILLPDFGHIFRIWSVMTLTLPLMSQKKILAGMARE